MVHPRFILVALTITLGFGLLGCAQGPSPDPVPTPGETGVEEVAEMADQDIRDVTWWRDESILAELRLTDDQLEAINELMRVVVEEGNQLRQQERRLSVNYLRALAQEPYDPVLVDRVSARLIENLSERNSNRVESLRGVRDILTQQQWTRLWEVAPRALQIGRIRVFRGPKISVSDAEIAPTPEP